MYRFDCSIILFIDIFNLCLLDARSSRDTQDKGDKKNLPDFKNRPGNVAVLYLYWLGLFHLNIPGRGGTPLISDPPTNRKKKHPT